MSDAVVGRASAAPTPDETVPAPGTDVTTSSISKIVIPVTGMTCAACSGRVQRALDQAPGVAEASVNLMMHNATIAYDPSSTSPEALVELIQSTGYGAELVEEERTALEEQEAQDAAQEVEYRSLRLKAIFGLVSEIGRAHV